MSITPTNVHKTIAKHMLADGMEQVIDLKKSHGSWMVDARDGKEYLDLYSMFASLSIGYNHPYILENKDKLTTAALNKVTNSDIYSQEMAEFVETMGRIAQPDYLPYAFYVEGGALAVENALKVAFDWKVRKNIASGKGEKGTKVIHFKECFHGRSGYTMSLTDSPDPRKTLFFPKFDWPRVSNPKMTFPLNESAVAEAEAKSIAEINAAIASNPDDIAAMILEPIQGEGGDNHFRDSYLQDLQRTTHDIGALFIVDEVQTGMGLTGSMWAYEQMGIEPDLLAFGKKMQVCGMMGGPRLLENEDNVFTSSSRINSTWGGNLIDMVRSSICLEVIEKEGLVDNARRMGDELLAGLGELAGRHEMMGNVRGRGLFTAFTLPSSQLRDTFHSLALEADLLTLKSGTRSIRLRPSLNISADEVAEALGIFEQTAKALEADQFA